MREPIGSKLGTLRAMNGQERPEPTKRKSFTKAERAMVFGKFEGRCCGCSASLIGAPYEIDHIREIADAGPHELSNWQLLCISCHEKKTSRFATTRGKANRIFKREQEGPKASSLKGKPFPKDNRRKIQNRGFPERRK